MSHAVQTLKMDPKVESRRNLGIYKVNNVGQRLEQDPEFRADNAKFHGQQPDN